MTGGKSASIALLLALVASCNAFTLNMHPTMRSRGRAGGVSSLCASGQQAPGGQPGDELQTNTGRFSKFADFDHRGMDSVQFREALKERMGDVRRNSPGNKATADYMSSLGGATPSSTSDSLDPSADSEASRIAERARKMLEEREAQ